MQNTYTYAKNTEVIKNTDVLVAGGGPAGIAAALSIKNDVSLRSLDAQSIRSVLAQRGVEL